jgi:tetratricopeptide (TPR) repeat protein
VRIKARYSLATVCLGRGLYPAAIQHYEEALRLCRHYGKPEELPHIYHGLCYARLHTGDLERAEMDGSEALSLYQQRHDSPMEARMYSLLGRVAYGQGDYRAATDRYAEALAIVNQATSPTMVMLLCANLAEARLAEGRLDEARRYCQRTLENMQRADNAHMKGTAYHKIGRVAREEARRATGQYRQQLLEEAMSCFQQAKELLVATQAYADTADVYSDMAQVFEELGRAEEAIECLRSGYDALSHAKDSR